MIVNLLLFLLGAGMLLAAAGALFTWRTARRIEAHLPPQGRFIDVPGARQATGQQFGLAGRQATG